MKKAGAAKLNAMYSLCPLLFNWEALERDPPE